MACVSYLAVCEKGNVLVDGGQSEVRMEIGTGYEARHIAVRCEVYVVYVCTVLVQEVCSPDVPHSAGMLSYVSGSVAVRP